jgi:hypothetical protein
MIRPVLRCLLFVAVLPIASAEEPAKKNDTIAISLISFGDIVSDAAKIAERTSLKKRDRDDLSDEELGKLRLQIPSPVLKLWMEAVPILEANSNGKIKAPEIFPPGLGEAIAKVPETELAGAHVFEVVNQLTALAEKVATAAPGKPDGPKVLNVPAKWVNDFLVERAKVAMAAMEASELNSGKNPVQNRGAEGIFVELGGMGIFRRISTADVPEIGPVYCAPHGKGGTWNLYQVINKPMTWLQVQSEMIKMMALPIPLEPKEGPPIRVHLVSIHSPEENDFVVQIAKGISFFWIGLNDRRLEAGSDPEGPWEWSSGEPVTWRNWFGKEPDSGGPLNPQETFDSRTDEDGVVCAGTLEPAATGKWKDNATGTFYGKNHRASFVVEWDVNAPGPIPGVKQLPAKDGEK